MNRFLLAFVILLAAALPALSQVEKGRKSFGVKGGYATDIKAPTAGISFEYYFSKHFGLAPNIDYLFRTNGCDALLFNIDYHGPWSLSKDDRWYVYHILGINYASYSKRIKDPDSEDDVTARDNNFGLDFGAGLACYVKPSLKLSLEGKLNWLRHHNTGIFTLGISYVF